MQLFVRTSPEHLSVVKQVSSNTYMVSLSSKTDSSTVLLEFDTPLVDYFFSYPHAVFQFQSEFTAVKFSLDSQIQLEFVKPGFVLDLCGEYILTQSDVLRSGSSILQLSALSGRISANQVFVTDYSRFSFIYDLQTKSKQKIDFDLVAFWSGSFIIQKESKFVISKQNHITNQINKLSKSFYDNGFVINLEEDFLEIIDVETNQKQILEIKLYKGVKIDKIGFVNQKIILQFEAENERGMGIINVQ
ncbi:Hypothetical_protein [Hexamita inflata]|uniref:Hypothetical_protein n=1 Tax=Hexamita inflata TaxID=28002 RepID=A0AA86U431_9EUKA|nr:Hypothetical protein HINF_LOCUS24857 [Hexamita inflata]